MVDMSGPKAGTASDAAGAAAALNEFIPLYRPDLSGNEQRYVMHCLQTSWISSIGEYVERFEHAMAERLGVKHAICVSNGTVALHLALHCLDLRAGDEVIVPTFTYIAAVNTIAQTGATPVFVDCRSSDWTIDAAEVARRITPRTRAIVAVHLYGAVCDMTSLRALADAHDLALVEDCAEALGSTLAGRAAGSLGTVATFSFFGNKTLTTGEGGMVATDDDALAARMRLVKGQGQSPERRYWHVELGFNYRMTNICAAIGLAQFERLDNILDRKRAIADRYRRLLEALPVSLQTVADDVRSSAWLVSLLLPDWADRQRVMAAMEAAGVETRPTFYCAHHLPMYRETSVYPREVLKEALMHNAAAVILAHNHPSGEAKPSMRASRPGQAVHPSGCAGSR